MTTNGGQLTNDGKKGTYLKRYDNQVSIDFLDNLAILGVNLIKAEAPRQKPTPVTWYGYYPEK